MQIYFKSFFLHHLSNIRLEGWSALYRKLRYLIKLFLGLVFEILIVPVVLLVRIIRPLVLIRFGPLRSDVIGNSTLNLEYYLSKRELEKSNTLDFFYFTAPPPNDQWSLMVFRQQLRVNPLVRYFDRVNQILLGSKTHKVSTIPKGVSSNALKSIISRTKVSHLWFTEEENNRGQKFLRDVGLQTGSRFVCLLVRDPVYKENNQNHDGNRDWSYHNYRDSDIDIFDQAALSLAEKGYWVFRMGKGVSKPFNAKHYRILDYANSLNQNDFLDMWLAANCYFMISSGAGLDSVAFFSRRPVVQINFLPFIVMNTVYKFICIPKYLKWKSTGALLTFSEQFKCDFLQSDKYESAGIAIQDLTPIEIKKAVLEMESRLSGTWEDTIEDIELQRRFWVQFRAGPKFKQYHEEISPETRIGTEFLRQNREWLY